MQEIGDEQEPGGLRGNAFTRVSVQLVERVEREALNAGTLHDIGTRHTREHSLHHAVRAMIAVADWPLDEIAAAIHQAVVNAPAIHADARHWPTEQPCTISRRAKPRHHFGHDRSEVPAEMSGVLGGRILKPPDLFEVPLTGSDASEKHPSASRSQVNREIE